MYRALTGSINYDVRSDHDSQLWAPTHLRLGLLGYEVLNTSLDERCTLLYDTLVLFHSKLSTFTSGNLEVLQSRSMHVNNNVNVEGAGKRWVVSSGNLSSMSVFQVVRAA